MEEGKVFDTNILMKFKMGMEGKTTIINIVEYPKALGYNLEILIPDLEDYNKAIKIMDLLLKIGKPIPAADTIIAAMCINRHLKLATKDKHFKSVASVDNEFELELV